MYAQATEKISEFHYRKLFGLSKQDMANEPLEDYFINSFIQQVITTREQEEIKRAERMAKEQPKKYYNKKVKYG